MVCKTYPSPLILPFSHKASSLCICLHVMKLYEVSSVLESVLTRSCSLNCSFDLCFSLDVCTPSFLTIREQHMMSLLLSSWNREGWITLQSRNCVQTTWCRKSSMKHVQCQEIVKNYINVQSDIFKLLPFCCTSSANFKPKHLIKAHVGKQA